MAEITLHLAAVLCRSSQGFLSDAAAHPQEAASLGALMLCSKASAAHLINKYPKVGCLARRTMGGGGVLHG